MGDELDGCECIWSHEMAMRRLLSIIRQGQSTCTDTECIDQIVPSTSAEGDNFTFMTMLFLFAVIMYFIRPSAFMSSTNNVEKPQQPPPGGEGPNNGSPPSVN